MFVFTQWYNEVREGKKLEVIDHLEKANLYVLGETITHDILSKELYESFSEGVYTLLHDEPNSTLHLPNRNMWIEAVISNEDIEGGKEEPFTLEERRVGIQCIQKSQSLFLLTRSGFGFFTERKKKDLMSMPIFIHIDKGGLCISGGYCRETIRNFGKDYGINLLEIEDDHCKGLLEVYRSRNECFTDVNDTVFLYLVDLEKYMSVISNTGNLTLICSLRAMIGDVRDTVNLFLRLAYWVNSPLSYVIKVENPGVKSSTEGKFRKRGKVRLSSYFTVIRKEGIKYLNPSMPKSKNPHNRRGHWRTLTGRHLRDGTWIEYDKSNTLNGRIWIDEIWVGPTSWEHAGMRYKLQPKRGVQYGGDA